MDFSAPVPELPYIHRYCKVGDFTKGIHCNLYAVHDCLLCLRITICLYSKIADFHDGVHSPNMHAHGGLKTNRAA